MFSLGPNEIGSLIVLIIYLVLVISSSRLNVKQNWKQVLIWVGVVAALSIGYAYHNNLSLKHFFMPTTPIVKKEKSTHTIEIAKANDGHFYLETKINGEAVVFLVDTGATGISLTRVDAKKAGIDLEKLKYSIPVITANGKSYSAPSSVESIKIGEIEFKDVYITVANASSDMSLMGVGFLKRFKSYTVENNKMILVYEQ